MWCRWVTSRARCSTHCCTRVMCGVRGRPPWPRARSARWWRPREAACRFAAAPVPATTSWFPIWSWSSCFSPTLPPTCTSSSVSPTPITRKQPTNTLGMLMLELTEQSQGLLYTAFTASSSCATSWTRSNGRSLVSFRESRGVTSQFETSEARSNIPSCVVWQPFLRMICR